MSLDVKYTGRLKRCSRPGCGAVERVEGEFKRCGRCKQPVYCGPECQKQDWKQRHRVVCRPSGAAAGSSQAGGELAEVVVMPAQRNLRAEAQWVPAAAGRARDEALAALVGCPVEHLQWGRPERGEPRDIYDIRLVFDGRGYQRRKEANQRASIILTPLLAEGATPSMDAGPFFCIDGPGVKVRGDAVAVRMQARWEDLPGGGARTEVLPGERLGEFNLKDFDARWGMMNVMVIPGMEGRAIGTVLPRNKAGQDASVAMGSLIRAAQTADLHPAATVAHAASTGSVGATALAAQVMGVPADQARLLAEQAVTIAAEEGAEGAQQRQRRKQERPRRQQ